MAPISGHVYRHEGARGPVWRAKYLLPDGQQGHRTIGPAWTERGRPRAGWYTKRTAEAWLRDVLERGGLGRCRGWYGRARPSPTRARSTCATSRSNWIACPRRSVTTGRSSSHLPFSWRWRPRPASAITTLAE